MPTTQDEIQRNSYPEHRPQPPRLPPGPDPEVQRKRMLIALGVLLVALVAVVLKDWDFWFPPAEDAQETATPRRVPATLPSTTPAPAAAKTERKAKAPEPETSAPFSATAERTVLPPLQVEVVAGNRHTRVPARSTDSVRRGSLRWSRTIA